MWFKNNFLTSQVRLAEFRVELWPGYITSIRQHEREVLVCAEVSHKVMRQDTLFEIIRNCIRDDERNWMDNFKRDVIGTTVLTGYNNATYRVDDVDFHSSPMSTFDKRGQQVTYFDYYREKYQLTIGDRNQPMLVSNPKARDARAGRNTPVMLVPELCRATGKFYSHLFFIYK